MSDPTDRNQFLSFGHTRLNLSHGSHGTAIISTAEPLTARAMH